MSNDVRNDLWISGENDSLAEFRESDTLGAFRRHATSEDQDVSEDGSVVGWIEFRVTTNNVPHTDEVVAASDRWPQLDFELRWHDPNGAIAGRLTCSGGEVTEQIEFTPTLKEGRFERLEWAVEVGWASGREPGPSVLTIGDIEQIGAFLGLHEAMQAPA